MTMTRMILSWSLSKENLKTVDWNAYLRIFSFTNAKKIGKMEEDPKGIARRYNNTLKLSKFRKRRTSGKENCSLSLKNA